MLQKNVARNLKNRPNVAKSMLQGLPNWNYLIFLSLSITLKIKYYVIWTSAAWPASRRVFYDMRNRVEHQKLNQEAAELPSGWVFGVQLGLRQTQALNKTKTIRRGKVPPASLLLSSNLQLSSNIAGGIFPLLIVFILIIDDKKINCHLEKMKPLYKTSWKLCKNTVN